MNAAQEMPHQIAQRLLHDTGQAIAIGDFDMFLPCMHLPMTLRHAHGETTLRCTQEMFDQFRQVRAFYAQNGIDRMVRTLNSVEENGPDRLRAFTNCALWAGDALFSDPYWIESDIDQKDGRWGFSSGHYMFSSNMARDMMMTRPATDKADSSLMASFQARLDRSYADMQRKDPDRFAQNYCLPLFVDGRHGAEIITNPRELARDLALYHEEFRLRGVVDLVRIARSAIRFGETKMAGTFTSYILGEGHRLLASYESVMHLTHCPDGEWRTSAIMHGDGHRNWYERRAAQEPKQPTLKVETGFHLCHDQRAIAIDQQ